VTPRVTPFYSVQDRWVLTYQPRRWPMGVITGVPDGDGGFAVEHVITISGEPASVGMAMMKAGLDEAWRRGFKYVTFHLPHDLPAGAALAEVGRRLGFVKQSENAQATYYVRWRSVAVVGPRAS
jgi:hypothetical protein